MSSLSTSSVAPSSHRARAESVPLRARPNHERRDHGDGEESDVRPDVILRARQRLACGYYDHPLAIHLAADKLARLLAQ